MGDADPRTRMHQTALRPELLPAQVHQSATDAMQQGLAAVVVPPVWIQRVVTMLQGGGVRKHTVVGFPHGTSKSTVKAIEATSCIKDGADAVNVVPHLPALIRSDVDAAKHELLEVVRAARATRRDVVINVILETAMLAQANADAGQLATCFAAACRAARESGCDGVVTASGFGAAGAATVEHVRLLRDVADGLTVTAAGAVDSAQHARELIRAGADSIWSERAAAIVVEWARAGVR